jgi:hypothetical protein
MELGGTLVVAFRSVGTQGSEAKEQPYEGLVSD